jgi:hypothetical protein
MNKPFLYLSITSILLYSCKKKQEHISPIEEKITESVYASGVVKSNHQYQVFSTTNGIIASGQGTNSTQIVWAQFKGSGNIKVKVTSPTTGCIDTAGLNITIGSTSVSNASPTVNALKVYPNPASTILNIDLERPGNYTAKLSSVAGQSIISPTTGTVDISALANGVYILTIYDSNNKLISTNKVAILK